MKQWYLYYTKNDDSQFLHQVGAEMQSIENQYSKKLHQVGAELETEKLHQAGGEFPSIFAIVPWRHHVVTVPDILMSDV